MRKYVEWACRNAPAVNTMLAASLIMGALCLANMRREVFPEFQLEILLVTVPYPGATPEEVEEGICQKIEEAVRSIDGIKKQTAVAREGAGFVVLELEKSVTNVSKVLSEVRGEVDRISTFPLQAEDPEVQQLVLRDPAIYVSVMSTEDVAGDASAELRLREATERVRDELLQLSTVSQANIRGAKPYQIDVEIPEAKLREYGLTLGDVAQIIRRQNVELPGGSLRSPAQEVILRGKDKHVIGAEIAKIPIVTQSDGVALTVEELGMVRDEFEDITSLSNFNGQPGWVIAVERTSHEDIMKMVAEVKKYVEAKKLPGYQLVTWGDRSIDVQDRYDMLVRNGLTGLVLVFLTLAVFLDLRLAFWVAMGIPVSLCIAGIALFFGGQTMNMLSMFAFLMALGIVVDDGIVIGENIFAHRQMGKSPMQAAVDGASEVLPSVLGSVTTTIIAFAPLMFVAGVMGKFIFIIPIAVIAMLIGSLIESVFSLPLHLSHRDGLFFMILRHLLYPLRWIGSLFAWINVHADRVLSWVIERLYTPVIRTAVRNPATTLSIFIAVLLASFGAVYAGVVPRNLFPKLDAPVIFFKITYPDGSPASLTRTSTERAERALVELNEKLKAQGRPFLKSYHRTVGSIANVGEMGPSANASGSHVGSVTVELLPAGERLDNSERIIEWWREMTGEFPGAERVNFDAMSFGPGGVAVEFKLLADGSEDSVRQLEAAVEECKHKLASYPGTYDVNDDSHPGKWEFQISVKEKAKSLGISLDELSSTVRAAYYGEEVMRLQRGRHEVKLMVRYPREDRKSLAKFDDIRVRTPDGSELPITELAEITVARGAAEINRVDQLRSITVSSNLDESKGNASQIVDDLKANYLPELKRKYPAVRFRWEGQQERNQESINSMMIGFAIAMVAMYVLLTIEFHSYLQPFIVMTVIPFGAIGAIWGHWLLGLDLTLFSMFGLVALAGVVVNDSIVLMDFINAKVASGMPLDDALVDSGRRRFRAVMLTSLTTVAGLAPMLMEKSFQAQVLIPMAAALVFGLMTTTVLVLVQTPCSYKLYAWWIDRVFWKVLPEYKEEGLVQKEHVRAVEGEVAANELVSSGP
jgi:multidrug efflux pump subunit AcrB